MCFSGLSICELLQFAGQSLNLLGTADCYYFQNINGTVLQFTTQIPFNGFTTQIILVNKNTIKNCGYLFCEDTKKTGNESFIVKVFTDGEDTEDYMIQALDTPADLIKRYVGISDSLYCLKTSSLRILENNKTLISQGVKNNSVLEGGNKNYIINPSTTNIQFEINCYCHFLLFFSI